MKHAIPRRPYTPLTDDEVRRLAMDYLAGALFTSLSLSPAQILHAFPQARAGSKLKNWIHENKIAVLYGYQKDAVRIDGRLPVFPTAYFINAADLERLNQATRALQRGAFERGRIHA